MPFEAVEEDTGLNRLLLLALKVWFVPVSVAAETSSRLVVRRDMEEHLKQRYHTC